MTVHPSSVPAGSSDGLIAPHGGVLVDLHVGQSRRAALLEAARTWPSWTLTPRQLCDVELLIQGGFSPLGGFLTQRDYDSVRDRMRLADGTLWPIPVTLDVTDAFAEGLAPGAHVALRDPEGVMVAVLTVTDLWRPDREQEAQAVFGTTDVAHPGVAALVRDAGPVCLGGRIEAVSPVTHYDFVALRQSPAALRAWFQRRGWTRIVAFQTRNPMHRAHFELTRRAATAADAKLLLHPVVGLTKPGDVDHYTRVRCYRALLPKYPTGEAALALLPLAMRMGGPREALWHAIIRKNYGCTHFIVGRDHAGPGANGRGVPFYGPYDAQELVRVHEDELGVTMVPFKMLTYVAARDAYVAEDEVAPDERGATLSGTDLRRRLHAGGEIPDWFTFPEVARELRERHRPRRRQGLTVFFTGLSGAGKSTIANALLVRLLEWGGRRATLLDGDLVRRHLSSELGFSKDHRDLNVRRIGFVAAEVTKHGGIAICAPIAPYDAARKAVRAAVERDGGFVLVHVATPLAVCEARDRKGLYAKARAGIVPAFTGISDPYEAPSDAEITLDTTAVSPDEAADRILAHLRTQGYLLEAQTP